MNTEEIIALFYENGAEILQELDLCRGEKDFRKVYIVDDKTKKLVIKHTSNSFSDGDCIRGWAELADKYNSLGIYCPATVRNRNGELYSEYTDNGRKYYVYAEEFAKFPTAESLGKEKTYDEKVREYIAKETPAIAKLRNLDELTQEEKDELETVFKTQLGSAADYAAWSENKPLLPFLRSQVGIADEAINTKFGSFYNENVLDSEQMEYMTQIINYTKENGDITFMDLQRISPFCDVDIMDLFGPKIAHIKALINGLHKPVM
jgi:type I restriction enzyme R subunit